MKKVASLTVALLFILSGTALADTIKIGHQVPLTGPYASEGLLWQEMLTYLVGEANKEGGLLGKKIELIVADDAADPKTAVLAAQRIVTKGAIAVIGTYGSSITEPAQSIYDEAGLVHFGNGCTAIRLSEKGYKRFFRICPRDDEQARVAADFMIKKGYKKVAILHDNSTFAVGLAKPVRAALEKAGSKVVFYDALTPGERDYSTIVTKMKAAKPEIVYFTGYYPETGLLLRQSREVNWNVPYLGADASSNLDVVKIAGKKAAVGLMFTNPPSPEFLPYKETKEMVDRFKEAYHKDVVSVWALITADGFRAILESIKATKSTDQGKMADYLHNKLKDFPGLTGPISFNEKGDRTGALYTIMTIDKDGKLGRYGD
jgi:branched-chain amino acid transport system substrate-binding protein